MARHSAQAQRWLAQGRGQGHGTAYRPWLQVRDVMSIGRSHKVQGIKIHRTYHVLSDLEAACLLVLEFERNVIDIREQFPLPTELTQQAAAALRIRHPTYSGTLTPQVLTSDFCADVQCSDSTVLETAIAVKYTDALRERRVRELLAIERSANRSAGRNWVLFTDTTVAAIVIGNLSWLRRHTGPREAIGPDLSRDFCQSVHRYCQLHRSLGSVLTKIASYLGITLAQALRLFGFAAWHQHITIRLDVRIGLEQPLVLTQQPQEPLLLNDDPTIHLRSH